MHELTQLIKDDMRPALGVTALPAGCTEIFAPVIRQHRLRRGRYYLPGCFPIGETTSAQSADNAVSNIIRQNLTVQCRNVVHLAT